MSSVAAYVAAAQRTEGDRVYEMLLALGATEAEASEAAGLAYECEREFAMLEFYGAASPEDV